jgi:hypothetical protein
MAAALLAAGLGVWLDSTNPPYPAPQEVAAMRHLGFTKVAPDDISPIYFAYGWSDEGFVYPVGICQVPIGIDHYSHHYRPYVLLKNIGYTRLYVTYARLKTLPQTRSCFVE